MSTSFIKSTIDFRQSSFSGFFAARSSRMAVTSTIGVDEGTEETADAAGVVGVGAVADSIVVPDGATDEADDAVAWPNIFAIRLVNIPIKTNLSSFAISGQLLLDFETCLKSNSQYAEIKYAAALWFWFPFVPARKGVPFPGS